MEMGWLFLLFVIDVKHGDLQPQMLTRQVFQSEQECNRHRRDSAQVEVRHDKSRRTFSVCLPQSIFAEEGPQTERLSNPR